MQYNLPIRLQDFGDAAKHCIEKIIEEKVDFIIHTGDIFHHYHPRIIALRQAHAILNELKKNNIPVFIIRGNHDASTAYSLRVGGHSLNYLQDIGLVNFLQDTYADFPTPDGTVRIWGLGYYGKQTKRKLEEMLSKRKDKMDYEILLLHAFLKGMDLPDSVVDLDPYSFVNSEFDYIGVGHYHLKWQNEEINAYCPGSTERLKIDEWDKKKGFYIVELENDDLRAEFMEIPTREMRDTTINVGTVEVSEAFEKAKIEIEKNDIEDAILRFVIEGFLTKGRSYEFPSAKLLNVPKKALYVIEIRNNLSDKTTETKIKEITKRDAIKIALTELGVDEKNLDKLIDAVEKIMYELVDERDATGAIRVIDELLGEKQI